MKKVLMAFVFCLLFSVSVQAKDVLPTDKTTAGTGCTLVGLEGKYIADAKNALKRINEIRKEAYEEGICKPDIYGNPTTEKLTLADYKPLKWSSDMEYIARIRAAEATVVLSHERPNGEKFQTTTLYSNGERSWGESLAWNGGQSMLTGIEQWYGEKKDWTGQTGEETGHYTSMINPRYTYVAVATFFNPNARYKNATSAEFSDSTNLDETMNEMNGDCIQTIEVKNSYLSLNLALDKTDIKVRENAQAKAEVLVGTCKASLQGDVTWSSSNEKVATVDKDGKVTGVDEGTATLTATSGTLSKTINITVTGHAWDNGKVTTAPKCEEKGVKTYTCTVCGKTKTEEVAATGHQNTEVRDAKAATCGEAGYTGDTYCKDCNKRLEAGKEIPATGHSWDKGKITTAPKCEEKGVKTYTCTVCGKTKTEEVAATGHQNTEVRGAKAATCGEAGYTGDTYCKDCNKRLEAGKEIPATGHSWNEGTITTAPKCEEKGVKTYTCTVCGKIKTEEVAATGHQNTEVRDAKAATCEEAGYTGDTYCKDCNKQLEVGKEIPATGHQHIEVRDAKAATCEETGYTGDTYCRDCNKKLEVGKEIAATGHSWDKGKVTTASTYKKSGIKTYTCKICGAKKTETISKLALPKTGTVYTIAGNQYKITKAGAEVSLIKTSQTAKTVTVPATISVKGLTYKVTAIASKAFKQNKKLKSVTIGANVRSISNNAFFKCPSLKTVNIKTVLLTNKTASKKAFKGANKKLVIKVPKKVKKTYQKIFKGIKVK